MARREWTDDEIADCLAIAAVSASVPKAAAEIRRVHGWDVPLTTLRDWKRGGKRIANNAARINGKVAELDESLEQLAHRLIGHALKMPLKDVGLQGTMVAVGITVDKIQLLRGKPTSIAANASALTPDERVNRLQELLGGNRAN